MGWDVVEAANVMEATGIAAATNGAENRPHFEAMVAAGDDPGHYAFGAALVAAQARPPPYCGRGEGRLGGEFVVRLSRLVAGAGARLPQLRRRWLSGSALAPRPGLFRRRATTWRTLTNFPCGGRHDPRPCVEFVVVLTSAQIQRLAAVAVMRRL